MKIVIDVREAQLERVGVAVYATNVIPKIISLLPSNYEITLLGGDGVDCPFQNTRKVTYLPIAPRPNSSRLSKLIWYYRLPFILKKMGANLYFGNYTILPLSKKMTCKTVFTVHDAASLNTSGLVGNFFQKKIIRYFVDKAIDNASGIISISNFCKEEFSEIFGEKFREKTRVAYHGLPSEYKNSVVSIGDDTPEFHEKFNIRKKYILAVGTISPKKNYSRLIDAFTQISRNDIDLVIIGNRGFGAQEIIDSVTRNPKSDSIHILESIETVDLCKAMGRAELFIFPSLYEGFGIPILEAFYQSIPVLCSDRASLPEIAGKGANYFDPTDVSDIRQSIEFLLNGTTDKVELISNGKKQLNQFSWDISAEKHVELIEDVLKG